MTLVLLLAGVALLLLVSVTARTWAAILVLRTLWVAVPLAAVAALIWLVVLVYF
jgi:hypothetical protein